MTLRLDLARLVMTVTYRLQRGYRTGNPERIARLAELVGSYPISRAVSCPHPPHGFFWCIVTASWPRNTKMDQTTITRAFFFASERKRNARGRAIPEDTSGRLARPAADHTSQLCKTHAGVTRPNRILTVHGCLTLLTPVLTLTILIAFH
jgi:hypothetical protein